MTATERPPAPEEEVETCLIPQCGQPAVRHLALAEARKGFPDLPEKGRRAPLCVEHYRAWKKATRAQRKLDRLTW